MKLLKRFFVLSLILGLITIGCQKEEQLPVDNLRENTVHERTLKNGDHEAYLNNLISNIEILVDDGTLNKGNGNALIVKINAAIKSLDKGNSNAANNQLSAFINQVEAFIQNGTITSDQAIVLIEAAEQAIEGDFSLIVYGSIIDARDGQEYITVKIGDQWWMAENLRYLPSVNLSDDYSFTESRYYVYGYSGTDVGAAQATDNYLTFGVLYNFEASKSGCPSGWHLPSDEEWKIMEQSLGMSAEDADNRGLRLSGNVGYQLKSISGWFGDGNGDNSSGFNALPGGHKDYFDGVFSGINTFTSFWTTTPYPGIQYPANRNRFLRRYNGGVYRTVFYLVAGSSVRCIKD